MQAVIGTMNRLETSSSFGEVASVIFVVAFVLSLVSAQTDLEVPTDDRVDMLQMADIQEMVQNLQLLSELKSEQLQDTMDDDKQKVQKENAACSCRGVRCQCCQYIRVKKLGLSDTCCLGVTYRRANYRILIVLRFGGRTLYSRELSARSLHPVCVKLPYLKKEASACIELYNLNIGGRSISGCTRLLVKLSGVTLLKSRLGCFHI